MLRSLTGRGATVICLGHCNKYPDAQGYPIYEGTGDLRSDFDELALLHGTKGNYGEVTTSLYWSEQGWSSGKSRAMVQPITWLIDVEDNREVSVSDESITLTAFEYRILEYLMLRTGEVVSKTELTEALYDQDFQRDSNVIEVFVGRLRRKLDPGNTIGPIETLRGRGYRFALERRV